MFRALPDLYFFIKKIPHTNSLLRPIALLASASGACAVPPAPLIGARSAHIMQLRSRLRETRKDFATRVPKFGSSVNNIRKFESLFCRCPTIPQHSRISHPESNLAYHILRISLPPPHPFTGSHVPSCPTHSPIFRQFCRFPFRDV